MVCADVLFLTVISHHCEVVPLDLRLCCSQDLTSYGMKGRKKKKKKIKVCY